MFRGYQGIIIVVAGLALLGAAPTSNDKTGGHPNQSPAKIESALDSISAAENKLAEANEISEYEAPCDLSRPNYKSDLCAQWYAATAARDAADWAFWALVVGLVGAVGIVAALWLTIDSNKIARETAQRQLRAYMVADTATADIKSDGFGARLRWLNCGQTPAYNVKASIQLGIAPIPNFRVLFPPNAGSMTVGSGKGFTTEESLSLSEFNSSDAATDSIWLYARVIYADIFGTQHKTDVCLKYSGDKDFAVGPSNNIAT
jgi:hypothetical protein